MLVVGVVGCSSSSNATGRATVDTDVASLPAHFVGSASVSQALGQLVLTITNVQSGGAFCEPANMAAGANVANLSTLQVRVNAFTASGDLVTGTYTNATAAFTTTDSSCTNTTGEVAANVSVVIDGSIEHISGHVRALFSGSLFVVDYDAPKCGPPTPSADASACTVLPACPSGDGAALCIDGP